MTGELRRAGAAPPIFVIPAQAGIQKRRERLSAVIPAKAGIQVFGNVGAPWERGRPARKRAGGPHALYLLVPAKPGPAPAP